MLITDLFIPHKGRRLIAANRKKGEVPFVGGSELNNSITDFSDVDPLFPGGWLTLIYNGSVGHTRYQPAPFFASDDVIALEPRKESISREALLVCAAIIQRECKGKYSYGFKLNLQRLNRQTILVPVIGNRENRTVDWEGMEKYGRWLLKKVDELAQRAVPASTAP